MKSFSSVVTILSVLFGTALLAGACSSQDGASTAAALSPLRLSTAALFARTFGAPLAQRQAMIEAAGKLDDAQWQNLLAFSQRVYITDAPGEVPPLAFHLPGSSHLSDLWTGMGLSPNAVGAAEFSAAIAVMAAADPSSANALALGGAMSIPASQADPDQCLPASLQSEVDAYVLANGSADAPPGDCIIANFAPNRRAYMQVFQGRLVGLIENTSFKDSSGHYPTVRLMTPAELAVVKASIADTRSQQQTPQSAQIWSDIVLRIANSYAAQ